MEKTLLLIKPDANKRELILPILQKVKNNGFQIIRMKTVSANKQLVYEHYYFNLQGENIKFLPRMTLYFEETPILAVELKRVDGISYLRRLIGSSDPSKAGPDTIRGFWGKDSYELAEKQERSCRNLVHASDSKDAYNREVKLWFSVEETEE